MFTGIVTAIGEITQLRDDASRRMSLTSPYRAEELELGGSIAHDGVCLTLVSIESEGERSRYDVEVSPETLGKTTLGQWEIGTKVNLERALRIGDELGGHLVQGHVDGVGEVIHREDQDNWLVLKVKAPEKLSPYIAAKGSIAVNGVSLTVNAVTDNQFDLMIIPHTAHMTTLGRLQLKDRVNLEIDVIARYAARLMQARPDHIG